MIRILFVCHGNICRSVSAELIMKELVRKAGLADRFVIESAATSSEELGNDIYPPAKDVLRQHHIPIERHYARKLRDDDYEKFDYLIGMDEANIRNMVRIFGSDPQHKVRLLLDETIEDPWWTDRFEKVYQQLERGCRQLLEEVKEKPE